MATLAAVLTADLAIPKAIETKFAFLPKLSDQMAVVANQLPAGPDIPGVVVTVLQPPAPNVEGQPLASFFNSEPITGPTLPPFPGAPAGTTTTAMRATAMPLSPPNPGARRGSIEYAGLPLSSTNPGASRGTILYNS